ncbi:MAG: hypothetical protein ABJQ21_00650 [Roseibium sp.]
MNTIREIVGFFVFWGAVSLSVVYGFYAFSIATPQILQCSGNWGFADYTGLVNRFGVLELKHSYRYCMDLNEFGDFLAGSFGPLAFLWLVLAVFLQRKDLKLARVVAEKQLTEMAEQASFMGKQVELLAETARLNGEQQARRDLDTLAEMLALDLVGIGAGGPMNQAIEDGRTYLLRYGKQIASVVKQAIDRDLGQDVNNRIIRDAKIISGRALEGLQTLDGRLGAYDMFRYKQFGLDDLVAQFDRLPDE